LAGYHFPVPLFRSILCAVDRSDLAGRVIYHAAGLVGATGARFTIVHVAEDRERAQREMDTERAFIAAVPYGATYLADTAIEIASGDPVDVIARRANERAADLIVCGTHARTGLVRMLLGSIAAGLLQRAERPVFLVGPTEQDIVILGIDRVALNFGALIVAVDIGDAHNPQLHVGSELAALSNQRLMVMTVARDDRDDHEVAKDLRARAHGLEPVSPHAVIVRRGEVAQEIARCAIAEGAGLVVMGVRRGAGRRASGAIAMEVLQTRRAHVVVVPGN
jgi:nucleotide-binding universal stress UspA family protein